MLFLPPFTHVTTSFSPLIQRPVPIQANSASAAASQFSFGSFTHGGSAYPPTPTPYPLPTATGGTGGTGTSSFPASASMPHGYPLFHPSMYYGPGSKMAPSPMAGSPSPAAFMVNSRQTPPPAHRGVSGSPFAPPRTSFPFHPQMPGMSSQDIMQWQHNVYMNHFRSTPPIHATMTSPFSPFSPFRTMGSPMMPFSPHFLTPHSPDPNGRFSAQRHHEVSSSRMSHSSAASSTSSNRDPSEARFHGHHRQKREKHPSHIKKPLNAFMLYMKEMRASVQSECTLKESAAINQILGKKWHALDRTEQAKYYEMAKNEREMHAKNNPGWTAKDNYAQCGKKKRRKKEKSDEPKKCRAIFGIDRQNEWCKPCRRKKKCIRYIQNAEIFASRHGGGGGGSGGGGGGMDYHMHGEPKSSVSDSAAHVSSSMQTLSPADSAASSNSPSSSGVASSG
ncbi:putative Protein pangolin, isoforms A/H/I/S [Hypsibius exemplaris]|uniref:dTCF n=1 Tax=Hypsibius exemplaris TaxID=2072580 RepID=A0A1W0WPQ8_HYPEX|nr:putative Protein pangolin, isoforms A/H/I/S [Hypsibius exemplaris]